MTEDRWSEEPADPAAFTAAFDRFYTRVARLYAAGVRVAPFWRRWLGSVEPHLRGRRVLEASVGTGWLLTRYAGRCEAHGIDLNAAMLEQARKATGRVGVPACLCRADVAALPYADDRFDTVVNTMAFSGYPDGAAAMAELRRVLVPGGRIVMVTVAFPGDGNRIGVTLARLWQRGGDILRDVPTLFDSFDFDVHHEEIGGWGSVHLYVADHRA